MDNAVIGLVIPNALERETQISLLGQMINCSQIVRTAEPSWWLSGLNNLVFFLPVPICVSSPFARILSRIFDVLLSMRISQFLLLSLAPFIRHSQLILKKICRSVMESSESSESKSDLGLGIIDTACLFCVAGSDWWANYKSLLEDFGLEHEIDETREAERYKFGDGGTLVSSTRVTAPVFVAGRKGRIVFSVVPSKHLPLLIGGDFLTRARVVVDMGERTLRIGTGVDNLVVSRAGHLALRLNPQDWHRETNLIEDIPVRLRARRKRQDPRTERLLQSTATVLINSRCSPSASAQKVSGLCLKNVAQPPHRDEHPRHCFVAKQVSIAAYEI